MKNLHPSYMIDPGFRDYFRETKHVIAEFHTHLGPVVQSIVSLTSSLRGQLVKCFTT